MSSISVKDWGADRELLIKLYKALIRSKLDYVSLFYSAAANSNLKRINAIEHSSLIIALGARKTSPNESNVMPLNSHSKLLLVNFSAKMRELPKKMYNQRIDRPP